MIPNKQITWFADMPEGAIALAEEYQTLINQQSTQEVMGRRRSIEKNMYTMYKYHLEAFGSGKLVWVQAKNLRKGYYNTKGGYHAYIPEDLGPRGHTMGRAWATGETSGVMYDADGQASINESPLEWLDLLVETWRETPWEIVK